MSLAVSPLRFVDVFGFGHIEPSVTGIIRLQDTEPVRSDPVNDLIILSAFRSGTPLAVNRFRTLTALTNYCDPDRTGDQGVALARMSKLGIGEQDMFGAADILTCRIDAATPSIVDVKQADVILGTITTADYGSQTRRARRKIEAGTLPNSKKLTLRDDSAGRVFSRDNLGPALDIRYGANGIGNASTATLTIRRHGGIVSYLDQPSDADKLSVNGQVYEFDNDANVSPGSVLVSIGATANATFTALADAINANAVGVTASIDTGSATVTLAAPDDGLVLNLIVGVTFTVAAAGDAASLRIVLAGDQTDGTTDLTVPLTSQSYKSISQLAAFINNQVGYTAKVHSTANKSMASSGLDVVAGIDVKTATVVLTAYMEAIADFVKHSTRGNYTMTIAVRGIPDNDVDGVGQPTFVYFTGGATPIVTIDDWENALNALDANIEKGGIILADTDDPSIMVMITEFIIEQRSAGKWFRAYCGTQPGLTADEVLEISAALDHSRVRLHSQRCGVFGSDGQITYLDPIFLAAALAGGAAGNRPYQNPLTNKILRFTGIHPEDMFDLLTRESLIDGGVTVVKVEEGLVKVALHVTTSRDPDHRMARIVSEIDTLDNLDSDVRARFLKYRGRWVNGQTNPTVIGEMVQLLGLYTSLGALVAGVDDFGVARGPWKLPDPASVIEAGVLQVFYDVFIGGELNHISIEGGAEYQRLLGSLSGNQVSASTAVPIR